MFLVFSTLLFWFLLSFITKDKIRAGLLISLFFFSFFSYGHIHNLLKNLVEWGSGIWRHRYLFSVWIAFFTFGSYLIIKTRKFLYKLTNFLNVVASSLVIISLINITVYKLKTATVRQGPRNIGTNAIDIKKPDRRPNIYYIILDAYARADILKEIYNYDNAPFLNYLKKKGFYVADKSTANYPLTPLSLSSSLNFRYLNESTDKTPNMVKDNRAFHFLRQHGYKIVTFSSVISYTDIRNADIYITPKWNLNEFQRMLMGATPIPVVLYRLGIAKTFHRKHILYILDHLPDTCKLKNHIFVFAHILCPHTPFVFEENGEPVKIKKGLLSEDRGWFIGAAERGDRREYVKHYRKQVIFINKKMIEIVDKIISDSSRPPIIILQGDHGPRTLDFWENPDKTYLKEGFSILNAYYLPGNANPHLYNEITPANTFRIIFNHYFGTDYELLDDKNYFPSGGCPKEFIDVTDKISS